MNQEITENPLENSVNIVMQPERCFVVGHIEKYLPGNRELKLISTNNPCYPVRCDGYRCEHHPWNSLVTSEYVVQDNMRSLSGIEIAIGSYIPKMNVSPKAIENLDLTTCTWLIGNMYRSLTDSEYKPNGDVQSKMCPTCDGHGNCKTKKCSLYMRRTSGLDELQICMDILKQ